MVIKIVDLVKLPSTYEDGDLVYQKVLPEIKAGRVVTVSFEGIEAVPSAFINSAFIRLLEEIPFEKIKETLRIKDSTKHINELIKSRFEFASKQ